MAMEPLMTPNMLKFLVDKCNEFAPADFIHMLENMTNASMLLLIKFEERFPVEAAAWQAAELRLEAEKE